MKIRTMFAVVLAASFIVGFAIGMFLVSARSPEALYQNDSMAFCKLDGASREAICPKMKLESYRMEDGSTVALYVCSRTVAYMEATGREGNRTVDSILEAMRRDGVPIIKVCDSSGKKAYRMDLSDD